MKKNILPCDQKPVASGLDWTVRFSIIIVLKIVKKEAYTSCPNKFLITLVNSPVYFISLRSHL